ncbi:MAG: 1-deoxy-D-xylulose-5-phosphate reductoisomerase [Chitinivibrionales bacterium]|nr:1-deoxy-D-xylulose-5-phosphate reductoisomerase [Chitinivibrionales bacterium]
MQIPTQPLRILLLGATGSIGDSTLNCVRRYPERFQLAGMAALRNHGKLLTAAKELGVASVCLTDPDAASQLRSDAGQSIHVYEGPGGIEQLMDAVEFDTMVNAVVGAAGLAPTVAALRRGKRVALANKESLVVGGHLIRELTDSGHGGIVPIDSEHSAILQCLTGEDRGCVESIILTASGGPFREYPLDDFAAITPAQALRHPTWSMGAKITIDSATLMNKGLEVIEAHHLFRLPYDRLRVCIHPQSIVHSMVEYHDGAVMAQMGMPDMELPIQYALEYPRRLPLPGERLNLARAGVLSFADPDYQRFPCLKLCIEAGRKGGAAPVVLNAANEVAVRFFLDGAIRFTTIPQIIEDALSTVDGGVESLEDVLELDRRTRQTILDSLKRYSD